MWDMGTFQTEKEDQCSSKSLLCNKQKFAKKIASVKAKATRRMKTSEGDDSVRKTMSVLWKLNDLDRPDDGS